MQFSILQLINKLILLPLGPNEMTTRLWIFIISILLLFDWITYKLLSFSNMPPASQLYSVQYSLIVVTVSNCEFVKAAVGFRLNAFIWMV